MARLLKLDPSSCHQLDADDACWYIGEYTANGGFQASETNQSIFNLKKKPTVPASQLQWKIRAIEEWGDRLARHLNLHEAARAVTFVPAPCSKPANHREYDDRMLRVLQRLATHESGLDIRPILITSIARQAQHESERISVADLRQSMGIDQSQLRKPLRETIVVVDDVITQGGTFKAMQSILMKLPRVKQVVGVFLAKTVWPQPDYNEIFPNLGD